MPLTLEAAIANGNVAGENELAAWIECDPETWKIIEPGLTALFAARVTTPNEVAQKIKRWHGRNASIDNDKVVIQKADEDL